MTRKKKTRTEKSIGAAKKPLLKQSERIKPNTKKKGKGRPSGAKANIDGAKNKRPKSGGASNKNAVDTKIGSKKAVELVPQDTPKNLEPRVSVKKKKPQPQLSLEQQLAQVENDERLNALLDQLDAGEELIAKDLAYIDHQTALHRKLLIELGIDYDDVGEEEEDSKEAWQQIDSSEFDEFKRK